MLLDLYFGIWCDKADRSGGIAILVSGERYTGDSVMRFLLRDTFAEEIRIHGLKLPQYYFFTRKCICVCAITSRDCFFVLNYPFLNLNVQVRMLRLSSCPSIRTQADVLDEFLVVSLPPGRGEDHY
jgi:hypothetical protein